MTKFKLNIKSIDTSNPSSDHPQAQPGRKAITNCSRSLEYRQSTLYNRIRLKKIKN